jgi:DNA mismatch repair protein MutL
MQIRVLPQDVASRIAAGEVIERPASVVKELVENSVDAGAAEIRVEVRQGGRRLIRVIDDGQGIPQEEAEIAFQRYATSKLRSIEDLQQISTLGFRGEALRSIAAVSQVTMVTRAESQEVGTLLRLEGGRVVRRESKGAGKGTVLTVENLFYNTPARLKFMRSSATEARHISELVTCYALAYPHLRFSLLEDGRSVFQSKGSGSLYDVLVEVYGLEVAQQMLEIKDGSRATSTVRVKGFVGDPLLNRADARNLTMLVNGRWVRDRLIGHAVREAYHGLLPKGRHPIAVLKVELPGDQVDVNVHPAKSEVRFRDTGAVYSSVQKAVRQALSRMAPVPGDSASFTWEHVVDDRQRRLVEATDRPTARPGELAFEVQRTAEPLLPVTEVPSGGKLPMLRVLGQLGRTYIIAEGPTGMYLIDQHAAHERVLYERFQVERAGTSVASQTLVSPVTIEPPPRMGRIEETRLVKLRELGFDIEPFGSGTYLVRGVPAVLQLGDIERSVLDILEEAESASGSRPWDDEIVVSLACHGATRSGQTLGVEDMRALIVQLEQTSLPRTCPHGRPTMVHVSAERLEKEFGRR